MIRYKYNCIHFSWRNIFFFNPFSEWIEAITPKYEEYALWLFCSHIIIIINLFGWGISGMITVSWDVCIFNFVSDISSRRQLCDKRYPSSGVNYLRIIIMRENTQSVTEKRMGQRIHLLLEKKNSPSSRIHLTCWTMGKFWTGVQILIERWKRTCTYVTYLTFFTGSNNHHNK